jgi:hypothetical protein
MSEYQHYEFMTVDQPLTKDQLEEVRDLSSHIEASSTRAFIEYHWGDFKHNPIDVLHRYFDGFLYWANWGSPHLAFRFPHDALPATFFDDYDLEDVVTFTRHKDYDILDIHFAELEPPDEWTEYKLSSLIPLREELLEGDLRGLYIAWLAGQAYMEGYDEEVEEEDYHVTTPATPPGLGKLTAAQQELADLLQVPSDLIEAAARHSKPPAPSAPDDLETWVRLLPEERRLDYLLRLARGEGGLSRRLLKELRSLGRGEATRSAPGGPPIPYATLVREALAYTKAHEREERLQAEERARVAQQRAEQERQRLLESVQHWERINAAMTRGAGYDAAAQYGTTAEFEQAFHDWFLSFRRRPALIRSLQQRRLSLPE